MRNRAAFPQLREQAIALRRAGRSRREISELLAITSNETLNEALKGEPPQPWTWRPNARRLSYDECRKRSVEGVRRYWAVEGPLREARREAVSTAAAAQIGELSDREILIAGAIAYWCEGAKNKPHKRQDRVSFFNSDPALIGFFLRFLDVAGITREQLIFRIQIHENADVAAAQRFWLDVTGADPSQFRRPSLKRHNPRTVRKKTGEDYHGCLRLDVRCSTGLYRQIEGWVRAATTTAAEPSGRN